MFAARVNWRVAIPLLALVIVGDMAAALSPPIENVVRHSVMRSNKGFVGRVVATRPFSAYKWERESLVVVDAVVFGAIAEADTVIVAWLSDRCADKDGGYHEVLCGAGPQLSKLDGRPLLWLVEGESTYEVQLEPLDINEMSSDRLIELSAYAEGQIVPNLRPQFKDAEALESDPGNEEKCRIVARYLREAAGRK